MKKYSSSNVYENRIKYGAFDVETRGLGGDLLSISYGTEDSEIVFDDSPDMIPRFIDYISNYSKPYIWYAHNAQYDWRYIIPYLLKNDYHLEFNLRSERDIFEIKIILFDDESKIKSKKIIMRDSYAIWPFSLKELALKFSPDFLKKEIDIKNFDAKNLDHIKYAKRDVEILLHALPNLNKNLKKIFSVAFSGTVAGTALRAWQKTIPRKKYYDSFKSGTIEDFIRKGYYGGLVFLTDTHVHKNCYTYDINSSYPFSMLEFGVPYGKIRKTDTYDNRKMGMFRACVTAPPKLQIPILASRDEKGRMRWRGGTFEGVFTSSELIFASKHGYSINEIYEGYEWNQICFPFENFISHCRDIRRQNKGQPLEILAKLMQNSLYGKFGVKRERPEILVNDGNTNSLIGAIPYDDEGYLYVIKKYYDDMLCAPHWAAFITAHARIRLLHTIYSVVGVEHTIYGDTDSITVDSDTYPIPCSDAYGDFKLEKKWESFQALAPKFYIGKLQGGEIKITAKGIPKNYEKISEIDSVSVDNINKISILYNNISKNLNTTVKYESLSSLCVALKDKKVASSYMAKRTTSDLKNSLNFISLEGKVYVKS